MEQTGVIQGGGSPAKNAETVPTSITFAIYALKTASGIVSLVLTTSRRSSNAKAAKQDITDSRDITPMKLVAVCMAELQIVNPMREVADIHEMRADQADKKALNSFEPTHPLPRIVRASYRLTWTAQSWEPSQKNLPLPHKKPKPAYHLQIHFYQHQ